MTMRSYKRKKPTNEYIEDVKGLCRLCLNKAKDAVPIFKKSDEYAHTSLAIRIMICVGLEMVKEECLPNTVCAECIIQLEKYYSFRKKCEMTYQKLKSHLQAVKEKESEKAAISLGNECKSYADKSPNKSILSDNALKLNDNQDVVHEVLQNSDVMENQSATPKEELPKITAGMSLLLPQTAVNKVETPDTSPNPDTLFKEILSKVLIELDLMNYEEDGKSLELKQGVSTLDLELADGCEITLQFIEEDDQEEVAPPVPRSDAVCLVCRKRFASRSSCTLHMRVHTGERPHACRTCSRTFSQRSIRARHELTHLAVRPFACGACGAGFAQRAAAAAHARTHVPPNARALRLHRCHICPKFFLHASGLTRHLYTHKGRQFKCSSCQRIFADKSSLLRHARNAGHSIDP